jgi:hypothetical protein
MTMSLDEANRILHGLWNDIVRSQQQAEIERIHKDPKRHKRTLIMRGKSTYRWFFAGETKRARYYYAVSDFVNEAGYFLVWREIRYRKPTKVRGRKVSGKRDQWWAHKNPSTALAKARDKAAQHLKRLSA